MNVNDCPDNELEDRFFHYLLPFFENHSKQENTNVVLEQFKSNINSMIYKRQLHVIPNDKTNKTLPYQALNRLVYKGNGTIIITDEVLRYICQISNINISLLKKSLVQNGHLSFQSHSTFLKSHFIHPVVLLSDNTLTLLMMQLSMKNFLRISIMSSSFLFPLHHIRLLISMESFSVMI